MQPPASAHSGLLRRVSVRVFYRQQGLGLALSAAAAPEAPVGVAEGDHHQLPAPRRVLFGEHLKELFREYFWASGAGPFRSRIGFEKLGSDLAPGADLAPGKRFLQVVPKMLPKGAHDGGREAPLSDLRVPSSCVATISQFYYVVTIRSYCSRLLPSS